MIIKIRQNPLNSNSTSSYLWLPLYLYHEPWQLSYSISFFEFLLYIFTCYVVIVNLRTFWKIQMFHRNFQTLATPMFGLWIELIFGKLITMAYQLEIIKIDFKSENFLAMWTDNEEKMLIVDSTENLELLIFAGFLEWHFVFTQVIGLFMFETERLIAFFWLDTYEKSSSWFVPISLTLINQLSAVLMSYLSLSYSISVITVNLTWILSCAIGGLFYVSFKYLNEKMQLEMENPNRKRHFTVSQRYQVKENLRFLNIAKHLIIVVIVCIIICGTMLITLIFDMVPPFLCHFVENCLFLTPLPICFVTMYSLPAWKNEFLKAFPSCKKVEKVAVVRVEPVEDIKKKLNKETDVYFEQLNKSWN